MKFTLICHIYNEQYLLPWFLAHHRRIFDHGVIIDYNSNDKSIEIIKNLCPTWDIIPSEHKVFDHILLDQEVHSIEKLYEGYKLVLNVTEFIVPFTNIKKYLEKNNYNAIRIFRYTIADEDLSFVPNYGDDLILTKNWGYDQDTGMHGQFRYLHNYFYGSYTPGRHDFRGGKIDATVDPRDFVIYWYGFAPWTDQLIKRKLQIKDKVSENDKQLKAGWQHLWSVEEMEKARIDFVKNGRQLLSEDLIIKYLKEKQCAL